MTVKNEIQAANRSLGLRYASWSAWIILNYPDQRSFITGATRESGNDLTHAYENVYFDVHSPRHCSFLATMYQSFRPNSMNNAIPVRPLIIAHRGGRFWSGESFDYVTESVRNGADIIELDVRKHFDRYVVQHSVFEKSQGYLEDAIRRIGSASLYLDVKDGTLDVNALIEYARSLTSTKLIIGSYFDHIIRGIEDIEVVKCCHCVLPWRALEVGRSVGADWISPLAVSMTREQCSSLNEAGFKCVPSGNPILKRVERLKNQVRFAAWGAHAISTHHVKEMRTALQAASLQRLNVIRAA